MKYYVPLPDVVVDMVRARGVPNQECVVLRTVATVDTSNLAMMVGYRDANGGIQCLQNHLFWFGDAILLPGTLMNIYTGGGQPVGGPTGNGNYAYNLFWGLDKTVFNSAAFIPLVVRLQHVTAGEAPGPLMSSALPQLVSPYAT